MTQVWADEFSEILEVLPQRPDLREAMNKLIAERPIPGKVTEGGDRLDVFRQILTRLVNGEASLGEALNEVHSKLPREASIHGDNNRVFPAGWEERLLRTQLSRFYNQAVLEMLTAEGVDMGHVPHSSSGTSSQCSALLAGKTHRVDTLHKGLVDAYENGDWSPGKLKVPEHPHCSHVVRPAP